MPRETIDVVFYHSNCADGHCCYWQLKKVFPDCLGVAVSYGEGLPAESLYDGRRVMIADFSYPPEQMAVMAAKAKSVITLDHHKSAVRKWDGVQPPDNVSLTFDESRSGAMLVWDWLNPARTILDCPWLVRYVQDRDLWSWQLPYSREINAYIASKPRTVEAWDELAAELDDGPRRDMAVAGGSAILAANERYVDGAVTRAAYWPVGPYRTVPVVNTTHLHSEVGERLCQDYPFSVTYSDDLSEGVRRWSFRSGKGGLDVSRVAEELGGGGHAPAAGAERRIDEPMSVVAGIVAFAAGKQLGHQASEVK